MGFHTRLISAALSVVATSAVLAGPGIVLVSPSLPAANEGNSLECRIVNLSGSNQSVTITSYDSDANLVGSNTISVVPGGWGGVSLPYLNVPGAGYCKFSVPGGRRSEEFRASINVLRFDFGIIASLQAY